jgi:hypothetical protein
MQSGTIEIRSGRWHWTIIPQWTGSTVVYQHRDRVHDEMRSWVQEVELTPRQALELAIEPLERTWMDGDGLKWRLSLELPSGWRNEPRPSGSSSQSMSLMFKRGGFRRSTEVPDSSRLGTLTHNELRTLLDQTSNTSEYAGL